MPMPSSSGAPEDAKEGLLQTAKAWGENAFPPTLLATLITAQHLRPFQPLPMLFPPVLLFSSYLNINGYKVDSAGVASAWSAAYLAIARRRKQTIVNKFSVRGIVRGATVGLCLANAACGGLAYFFGRREKEDTE
ncbi:hypothetical protein K431DRAFT_305133 [Polychaeton citri CBS 116435]|uniref:Uncharacterized protein n=1 Tax=Polychaeton citri CBS 116435 TaxID=1314669 RepID=A0A9P4UNL7_9PEZI|nr:hypothetical protein K431DRAFT_305133 [Polychaeton citri CBS 116435]